MMVSRLDLIYTKLIYTKFFSKGWGKPDNLKRIFEFRKLISNRESCMQLVNPNHPITIDDIKEETDCNILNGHFTSPMVEYFPDMLPKESHTAYFQVKILSGNKKSVPFKF